MLREILSGSNYASYMLKFLVFFSLNMRIHAFLFIRIQFIRISKMKIGQIFLLSHETITIKQNRIHWNVELIERSNLKPLLAGAGTHAKNISGRKVKNIHQKRKNTILIKRKACILYAYKKGVLHVNCLTISLSHRPFPCISLGFIKGISTTIKFAWKSIWSY